jgi:hypothetical protein
MVTMTTGLYTAARGAKAPRAEFFAAGASARSTTLSVIFSDRA